ncbi:MAG: PD40 domain-containing protein [Bacteriovoracaceae bacterium]|nr:PD40 domain-containing protein [Bacteriovoracaceae bacterium]
MFKLAIHALLIISMNTFAQDDSVTIVAVGDAEKEKDSIVFSKVEEQAKYKEGEQKKIKELGQLLIDDFNFYRHLFEVSEKRADYEGDPGFEKYKSERYLITSRIFEKEKELWGEFKIYDVVNKRLAESINEKIWINNIRKFGHSVANRLYKAVTGNESIFNTKIVFISDRTSRKNDLRKEIYIMDFDGHKKQRITFKNSLILSPAISPDNKKLLFTSIESRWKRSKDGKPRKIQNLNLYIYDLATRQQRVVSQAEGINSGAIFSTNGEDIYLTLSNLKNADIFKMNLATGKKKRVTTHFLDDVDPHINQDGSLMTFLSGRSGKAMIYTMDPSSAEKDVKRISFVGRFNASPRFSPDGKEIVFASWVDKRFDIYKIDSSGNNLARLTKDFGSNEEPWFSPDGQFIVFTSQRVISSKKAEQDIYIMNRDGEIIKKITENYGKTFTPRWSNF